MVKGLIKILFLLFSLVGLSAFKLIAEEKVLCSSATTKDYANLAQDVVELEKRQPNYNSAIPYPRAKLLEEYFNYCIAPVIQKINLKDEASKGLENLLNAVSLVNAYRPSKKRAKFIKNTFDLLVSKGEVDLRLAKYTYTGLIASRMFDEARKFEFKPEGARLPEYLEVEEFKKEGARSIIQLSANASQLTRKSFNLGNGAQIIISAHPNCHFTRNAFSQISDNPRLSKIMETKSTLLMPIQSGLTIDSVAQWNMDEKYHKYPMNYIYNEKNWPEIDEWGTPIFYFFSEGQLKSKLIGWPKKGRMEELKRNLGQIGLLKTNEEIIGN